MVVATDGSLVRGEVPQAQLTTRTLYLFGEFEVDVACSELRRAGRPVRLRAKVLRLLVTLLANRSRTLSVDDLIQLVWHGTAVSDSAVFTTVKELRRALADDGTQQQWLQSRRGIGYRFAARVTEVTTPPPVGTVRSVGSAMRADSGQSDAFGWGLSNDAADTDGVTAPLE